MKLKEKYYNGWIQRKCRGAYDQKKRMRLFQEGLKQGRDQNDMWLMMGPSSLVWCRYCWE